VALPQDDLGELVVRSLGQHLGFEQISLTHELLPLGKVHLN